MQNKVKYGVAIAVLFGTLAYLIMAGVSQSAAYYMTVDEVLDRSDQLTGKSLRVSGLIDESTVRYDPASLLLTFTIRGAKGPLAVSYKGLKPDNMNDQWEAIVEGRLVSPGAVTAAKVLIKCPSRYESHKPGSVDPSKHPPVNGKPHPGTDAGQHPPVNRTPDPAGGKGK